MAKKLTTLGKTVGNLGRLSCSLSLLLGAQMSFATGITMITSELVPLAINAEGDVLCKSRYSENSTGAHRLMPTNYGLCLVKNGEVEPVPESDIHFAPDFSEASAVGEYRKMERQFKAVTFTAHDPLVEDFYEDLVAEGFRKIDLADYQLMPAFSVQSFKDRWKVDYVTQEQVALYSRDTPQIYGDYDANAPFLKASLRYQINDQIWLQYEDCPDDMSLDCDQYDLMSPEFYYADYGDELEAEELEEGAEISGPTPYEWKQKVTSIIFLPEI